MRSGLSLLFNNTPCLPKFKSTIVLLYNKCMLCISCHFRQIKTVTLLMDHAKLFEVLTSLPVSQSILPRAVGLQRHVRQIIQYVVILTQVNIHLGQSEDVYL